MEKNNIISHVEWVVTLATLIGSFYILDAKFDAKIDAMSNRMDSFMIAWHEEAKDFHGRLERMDAEFKAHLIHHQEMK